MLRLNVLSPGWGGRSRRGESAENGWLSTKHFVTPFTPLSGVFGQVVESRWLQIVRMHRNGRGCSLYSNECHIPKLDVAGSSPVSRSNLFNNLRVLLHLTPLFKVTRSGETEILDQKQFEHLMASRPHWESQAKSRQLAATVRSG